MMNKLLDRLRELGFGDQDADINGGDVVDVINELWDELDDSRRQSSETATRIEVDITSNIDWALTPSTYELDPEQYREMIERGAAALRLCDASNVVFYVNDVGDFFDDAGKPFDFGAIPYDIEDCRLSVYQDGTARLVWLLKHTGDEFWTDEFSLERESS